MPSSSSRVSALTSSTNHCILRMYGMPRLRMTAMHTRSTTMATMVTEVHWNELPAIFQMAHTAMMGALTTDWMARPMNCCRW